MRFPITCCSIVILSAGLSLVATADDGFDLPPIEYSSTTPVNCVSELQSRLDEKKTELRFDEKCGYLGSLLEELQIPVESQTLVFSKTSMQMNRISPRTPRALYFNDDAYVGFCHAGEMLEITVADPQLGAVFYTLEQKASATPRFLRETDRCLQCHESSRTEGVPGFLMRSLYVSDSGLPIFSGGSYNLDHTTPFEQRWGGWYVTGTHGSQRHLGNLVIAGREVPRSIENLAGQNLTQLPDRVQTENYLTPYSDLVALMVLEHQVLVHNRITKAGFAARQALHSDAEMRQILGEPDGPLRESTVRRLHRAGDDLVDALLMVNEAKLTAPIAGVSGFAEVFVREGPHDERGRSLRDLDLTSRMFKHPCSYLIGSQAFKELPTELRDYVWRRMWSVLVEGAEPKRFSHLSESDRRAIVEIVRATQPHAPEFWRTLNVPSGEKNPETTPATEPLTSP
jgi:hypothetical protein